MYMLVLCISWEFKIIYYKKSVHHFHWFVGISGSCKWVLPTYLYLDNGLCINPWFKMIPVISVQSVCRSQQQWWCAPGPQKLSYKLLLLPPPCSFSVFLELALRGGRTWPLNWLTVFFPVKNVVTWYRLHVHWRQWRSNIIWLIWSHSDLHCVLNLFALWSEARK